jgi:hypothetical protein
MRIVMIMAMIMEKQQESDPFTLFHLDRSQMVDCLRQIEAWYTHYPQTLKKNTSLQRVHSPGGLFALAGAVSTLGCLAQRCINSKLPIVHKIDGNCLPFAQLRCHYLVDHFGASPAPIMA